MAPSPQPAIAFSTWAWPDAPIEHSIDFALDHEFEAIEIAMFETAAYPSGRPVPTPREAARIRARLPDRRITVHAPMDGLYLGSPERDTRQAGAALLLDTMRSSAEMGADVVVVHLVSGAPGADDQAASAPMPQVLSELRALAESAAELGIIIGVENIGFIPTALDGRYEDLRDLIDALRHPHVAITLDVGHANVHVAAGGVGKAQELFGARIAHYHVHDNDGTSDQHRAVGTGSVDLAPLLPAWSAGAPVLTLEVFPFNEPDVAKAILDSRTALQWQLGSLDVNQPRRD